MYGISQAAVQKMDHKRLLNNLIAVVSQNNEMDCRDELEVLKTEVLKRLLQGNSLASSTKKTVSERELPNPFRRDFVEAMKL